jgi:endonuclease III
MNTKIKALMQFEKTKIFDLRGVGAKVALLKLMICVGLTFFALDNWHEKIRFF